MAAILFFTMSQIIFESKHHDLTVHFKPLESIISETDTFVKYENVGDGNSSKRETTNQSTGTKITQKNTD